MSYEQSVIDEIAARYGVPVTGTVQIVPRGASGIFTETPVWNGLALVYPSQMGHGNGLRDAQKRARANYARKQKFERAAKKAEASEKVSERREPTLAGLYGGRVRFLAEQGKPARQIAAEAGICVDTVRNIARYLGIPITHAKSGPKPRERAPKVKALPKQKAPTQASIRIEAARERRVKLAQLLTDGITQREAFKALGVSRKSFSGDLKALGVQKVADYGCTQASRAQAAAETAAKAVNLYASHMTSFQIAEAIGCSVKTVNRALAAKGLTPIKADEAVRRRAEDVRKRREAGMTFRAIAADLGLTPATVHEALYGQKPRPKRVRKPRPDKRGAMLARFAERRQQIADMLAQGLKYRDIVAITGASSSVISDVSRSMGARA